jgi:hypothetical protein
MQTTEFEKLQSELSQHGIDAMLDQLADELRAKKQYRELYEALKMRVRRKLGLPPLYGETPDDLTEQQRRDLEDGLLAACREVGLLLLREGSIREGWMYLRLTGDTAAAAAELAKIEADEDHLEELIEVSLHEGVDLARGFRLVLENYGTCNAITTFEGAMHQRTKAQQQTAAGMLVEHLHKELVHSVKTDIARQEGSAPPENTLRELVAERDWLFLDNSYHIDTTHLASVVRFSRMLDDERQLRLALDLTEYGRRLGAQFQYQSDEPFTQLYPSHALYLQALLGENVDEALAYFRQRAEMLDIASHGSVALEIYVHLLARLQRYDEAIAAAIDLTPADQRTAQYVPLLLELSQMAGKYDRLLDFCRQRGDLLGYGTGLVQAALQGQ